MNTQPENTWQISMEVCLPDVPLRGLTSAVRARLHKQLQEDVASFLCRYQKLGKAEVELRNFVATDRGRASQALSLVYKWAKGEGVLDSDLDIDIFPEDLIQKWRGWSESDRTFFEILAEDLNRPHWAKCLRDGNLSTHYPHYLS